MPNTAPRDAAVSSVSTGCNSIWFSRRAVKVYPSTTAGRRDARVPCDCRLGVRGQRQKGRVMPTDIVLDVSVVIAAMSPGEAFHSESLRFIQAVHRHRLTLEVPAHFLLELYAVLTRSPRELRQLGFMTEIDPVPFRLRAIGETEVQEMLAWISSQLPGKSPTRGADLAYVWVARASRLPLVSLDKGLHQFTSAGVSVCYPGDLLSKWSSTR